MSSSTWQMTSAELAQATGGQLLSSGAGHFSRVSSDSRADLKGKLFVALQGERFDAHDFVEQAVSQGAAAVLVHEFREAWRPLLQKAAFVQVSDTLKGLQALGHFWRRKNKFFVLGVTGSNGKTSTKEFTYALLKTKYSVYASKGSYNNHWGVPLSILEAGPEHTHLILEMGMSNAGELFRLAQIGEPNVVIVTMVGRAHIGELGSQANVAAAKEEIYEAAPSAVHVFNLDNEWTMRMQPRSGAKQITFSGFKTQVDVNFRAQRLTWDGLDIVGKIKDVTGHTWVHVIGRQNVVNLMAASALALAAEMKPEEIWAALSTIHDIAWGRNQVVPLKNGARVLFDGYNANPDSMQALLKNIYEMESDGRKFLIAGDMKQQGAFAESAHEEIGALAAGVGFEGVWFIGEYGDAFERGFKTAHAPPLFWKTRDVDQAHAKKFLDLLKTNDLVALKASRGMALERVLEHWPLSQSLGKKP